MSIRNFARVPCSVCKRDTIHIAMACTECKTIQATALDAWKHRQRERYLRRIGNGMDKMHAKADMNRYRSVHNRTHRQECNALPLGQVSRGDFK